MNAEAEKTLLGMVATKIDRPDAHADLRYSLGFLVGRELDWVPAHFVPVPFVCPLHVHPNASVAVSSSDDDAVAVIGEAIHPDHPEMSQSNVAALLLRRTDSRQAEIDKLVGRFAIIDYDRRRGLAIQSDAIGMRGVFFGRRDGRTIAASSASLAAQSCDVGAARRRGVRAKWGYPGIQTPFAGISRLPPNSSLELDSGAVRRFFPLEPIEPSNLIQSWDYAFSQAHQAVCGALNRRPVLLSLSAGLDTRTSLAATRGIWPKLTFFTYHGGRSPLHQLDVLVASDIARSLGLRHLVVDYCDLAPDPSVMEAIGHNTFASHSHQLACAYHRHFGPHKFLHFRTNLLELTRSNLYHKNDARPEFTGGPATAQQMAGFYAFAAGFPINDQLVAAFAEYHALTDFSQALRFANAWDLFFVEHRMGAWHAGLVAESDVAFETLIAFNSRNIIRRFMGVPQKIRSRSGFLRGHLKKLLPEIAHIPINPRAYSSRPPASSQAEAIP